MYIYIYVHTHICMSTQTHLRGAFGSCEVPVLAAFVADAAAFPVAVQQQLPESRAVPTLTGSAPSCLEIIEPNTTPSHTPPPPSKDQIRPNEIFGSSFGPYFTPEH